MTREILFKAKCIGGEHRTQRAGIQTGWTFLSPFADMFLYLDGDKHEHYVRDDDGSFKRQIDVNTLCQFTGLLDSEGEKIFESDVLSSDLYPFKDGESEERCVDALCVWNDDQCRYDLVLLRRDLEEGEYPGLEMLPLTFNIISSYHLQVIGNIYDENELCKKIRWFKENRLE